VLDDPALFVILSSSAGSTLSAGASFPMTFKLA
jgi:hypothetical protein